MNIRNTSNTCTFGAFVGNDQAIFASKWAICKTCYGKYYITTAEPILKLKSVDKIKEHLLYLTKSYNELEREMSLRIKKEKIEQMKKNIEEYFTNFP
jgi:hypothetical protein